MTIQPYTELTKSDLHLMVIDSLYTFKAGYVKMMTSPIVLKKYKAYK